MPASEAAGGAPSSRARVRKSRVVKASRAVDGDAVLGRAAGLIRAGYTRQAVRMAQDLVRRDPNNGRAHRVLGIGYSILGNKKLACDAYRRYLLEEPNAPDRPQVKEILRGCR